MEIQKHNPDYKLIGVTIGKNDFVFGQTNSGENAGLEVYYYKSPYHCDIHYSRRFAGRKMPMIYDTLAMYLSKLLPYCPAGHKITLEDSEYCELVVLFNMQPSKFA